MGWQRFGSLLGLLALAIISGRMAASGDGFVGVPAAAESPRVMTLALHAVSQAPSPLAARVVAVGIPGAGAISPVGRFLPGGPIHDVAAFAAYTEPGRVLDPNRILVGSSSNFGAPLADSTQAEVHSSRSIPLATAP